MSIQRDIDAELRFHFSERIEELVRQGMSRDEAHARAIAEFGDVDAVRTSLSEIDRRIARRRSRADLLDGLRQDVAYAVRSLRRTPAVAVTIILTLALGLGANAAMFSLLDVIFLRPPAGVARSGAVRRVWFQERFSSGTQFSRNFDFPGYSAIARAVDGEADITFYEYPEQRKLGKGENAPTVSVGGAAANYFDVLGVRPQAGRFYSADEDRKETATPVAVISDAFWQREFDRAPSAIGTQLVVGNDRYTVIGVAAPHFTGVELDATDIWVPTTTYLGDHAFMFGPWWRSPSINAFQAVVRLRPNARERELVSRTTAALRVAEPRRDDGKAPRIAALGPIVAARGPGELLPEMHVATRLAGVAIIVLLIACANVVNLLLARAVKRRREIAVRLALGVSRARLVRMLVVESVLLATVASVVALTAAAWGGVLLRRLLMPTIHFAESPVEWRVLAFALSVAVAAGVLSALAPALQSASTDLTSALKSGARAGWHRSRLRDALVVAQAALSVVLLVGAVLFIRSLRNVKGHDVGYTVNRVAFASLEYDTKDSARDAEVPERLRALEPRIAAIPGVERVAFTSMRPKWGFTWTDYYPDIDTTRLRKPDGFNWAVSPNYFAAIGTRIIRGRTFSAAPSAAYELIVDEAMAKGLWPNQDPIGHCVRFKTPTAPCAIVIGLAQTALFATINEKPSPHFYISLDHPAFRTFPAKDVVVRASPERLPAIEKSLGDLLRAEFHGAVPVLTTMSRVMEPEYRPWQLGATLFTLFGVLALLVAGIGMYSTVSYAVSQRTHEFGIRIALGAQAKDLLGQVVGEGVRTVAIGVVVGVAMALAAGRFVASLLYGIAPTDPAAMATVAIVLLLIAVLAAMMPARRAASADPVSALRAD